MATGLYQKMDDRELDRLRNKAQRLEFQVDELQSEIDNIVPYNEEDKDTLSDIAEIAKEALFRHRNGYTIDLTEVLQEIESTARAQAKRSY